MISLTVKFGTGGNMAMSLLQGARIICYSIIALLMLNQKVFAQNCIAKQNIVDASGKVFLTIKPGEVIVICDDLKLGVGRTVSYGVQAVKVYDPAKPSASLKITSSNLDLKVFNVTRNKAAFYYSNTYSYFTSETPYGIVMSDLSLDDSLISITLSLSSKATKPIDLEVRILSGWN
jgi:hypothetical protein